MIERKFVSANIKEFQIKEFVGAQLSRVGLSDVKLQRTPLGEKIIVSASRPGLVVGRSGSNIQKLTKELKEKFNLENPQIEIEEIKQINLDPSIVAEGIASSLERFGTKQFKGAGHKAMTAVMEAGALGIEILISGKIPSQRARTWRFYEGYLKKCGDIALTGVHVAYKTAHLKTGVVGIKVSIMPGDTRLPDRIDLLTQPQTIVEEVEEQDSSVGIIDEETKQQGEDK
jgi:small subunit ribosomal protein S3